MKDKLLLQRIIKEEIETMDEGLFGALSGLAGVGKKITQKVGDFGKSFSDAVVNKVKDTAEKISDYAMNQYRDLETSFKEAKRKGDEEELRLKIRFADKIVQKQVNLLSMTLNKVNQYRSDLGEPRKNIMDYMNKDVEI